MIALLVRRLIRDSEKTDDPAVRQRYGVLAGAVGLVLNLLLSAGKLAAGALTGAISITADAFNNLSDAASSLVTLAGFRMAGQRPDRDHPFGHGRVEYLAGLAVSVLILVVGVELAKSSLDKILHPEAVAFSWLSAGILAASILTKLWMGRFYRILGRRIQSAAMAASAIDSLSDAAATAAVLAGLALSALLRWNADGWIGLLVAGFILRAGFGSVKDTLDPLLGQPPERALVDQIERIILDHPQIVGVHDLVIHDYGPGRRMMSAHAEVPAASDFLEIHDVVDHVERELRERCHLEAVLHMDPVMTDDPHTARLCARMARLVRQIDPAITIHDFRTVPGPVQTKLVFDVAVPYACPRSDDELRGQIAALVEGSGPRYRAVVDIDRTDA